MKSKTKLSAADREFNKVAAQVAVNLKNSFQKPSVRSIVQALVDLGYMEIENE